MNTTAPNNQDIQPEVTQLQAYEKPSVSLLSVNQATQGGTNPLTFEDVIFHS